MGHCGSSHRVQVRFLAVFLMAAALSAAASLPSADSPVGQAAHLYADGQYSSAVTLLGHSGDSNSLQLLGQCYYMLGDFKRATDSLEKAAAISPKESMLQTWLGRAWGMRAESAFPLAAIGQAGKARDAFERAVQLDPKNQEALGDLFDFYMEAPGMIGGGMDKAESLLPKYAQYDPLGFHIAKARLAEKKQQYDAAEASLRKAVETSPRTLSLKFELAQFLARRGRYDESESMFRKAEETAPNSPRILYARASAYVHTHRNGDEARALLGRYIATPNLTPDDPPRWEAQKLLRKAEGK